MADNRTESTTDDSNWLESVAEYIKETGTNCLDLEEKQLKVPEVKYILNILCDSQVTELNLTINCLKNGMLELAPLLTRTKIKKLNVSWCSLTKEDLLHLIEVLEHTQITDLDVTDSYMNHVFSCDEGLKLVSDLKRSKVTTLTSTFFKASHPADGLTSLLQVFLSSSITNLDLERTKLKPNEFSFLFANLSNSSVKDLSLRETGMSGGALQELSRKLAEMKIEKLNLCQNEFKDNDLDILMAGITKSNVTDLDLSCNKFSNFRSLFTRLKETKITALDLSYNQNLKNEKFIYSDYLRSSSLVSLDLSNCELDDEAGEGLIENLRFSKVTKLDVSENFMKLLTVKKFAENVQDFDLTDLDLSNNVIGRNEFLMLGNCLKESKLARLDLNKEGKWNIMDDITTADLLMFLKQAGESSISHIEMYFWPCDYDGSGWFFDTDPLELDQISEAVAKMFTNTTFTELKLAHIRNDNIGSRPIAGNLLKYSSIIHLDLTNSNMKDNEVAALAECLKMSPLRRLTFNNNNITSKGAKALAAAIKDSHLLYLHLDENRIEDDGLKFLAEHAKDTFISVLDVAKNPGKNVNLIEKVIWQNKIVIQKLITSFNQIFPQTMNDEFRFDQSFDGSDVSTSLEKWMRFYKTFVDNQRIINIFDEEKSISFSREQILKLFLDEFPLKFSQFVGGQIEANLEQHISILEKAEEMSLTAIVKDLLYNREAYVLDKEKDILHPYVYKLLRKYNQPICSSVEPRGVEKIIEYFTEQAHIEGAEYIVNLLRGATVSSNFSSERKGEFIDCEKAPTDSPSEAMRLKLKRKNERQ